jgi:prefoldin subunit 5
MSDDGVDVLMKRVDGLEGNVYENLSSISDTNKRMDLLSKRIEQINSEIRELYKFFYMMVDDMKEITKKIEKKGETDVR